MINVEDNKPEIICRDGDRIVIISNKGLVLRELSSINSKNPLSIVPNWDDKMALVDGTRLLLFDLDLEYSYWLNPRSNPSGLPIPTGFHSSSSNNMSKQKAYNYPNPITNGYTRFRFFVENPLDRIQIRIYDAAGFLVNDELELMNPISNEFNEIEWNEIQVDSGLYLAEIKREIGKSELVRLVVIR